MNTETPLFDFHPISLTDQEWVREKLREDDLSACELSYANNFIWSQVYDVAVCQVLGCGIIRYVENGEYKYSFPFGDGDKKQVITLLHQYCAEQGKTLCMYPIEEESCRLLKEWFPGQFLITSFRGDYDYIYTTEKLSTLKGKKLHGKRNHIARFMDEPDWNYEPLTRENMDECRYMSKNWIEARAEKWNEEMDDEMHVLNYALDHFEDLGLIGGVLRRKGEVIAFTIGEPLNSDTFVVHFEKAIPDIQGAYPMINQQFVLHECQNFTYVNREEDTGDLGLRKAKLSYYPDILLKKYNATSSHVVYASDHDLEDVREIWKTCFGDEDEYIDLYLKHRFTHENMLIIHMDGKPVSMASFLPVTITIDGKQETARYVYAVATLPGYRGRGYATEILRFAMDHFKEPLILQPAEASLEEYYGSLGFVKAFGKSECMEGTRLADRRAWTMETVDAAEYKRIRDEQFAEEGYMAWDEEAISYAIRENEFCGGKALKLICVENAKAEISSKKNADVSSVDQIEQVPKNNFTEEAILMYRVDENTLYIMETSLCRNELQALLPSLMEETHTTKVEYPHIGGMILCVGDLADALSSWTDTTGYLGLTLG